MKLKHHKSNELKKYYILVDLNAIVCEMFNLLFHNQFKNTNVYEWDAHNKQTSISRIFLE